MIAQTIKMYSEKEYLELEREAEYKSEYYQGEIFAMAGAGYDHNRIKENLSIEIGSFLKGKSCKTFSSDMRLHIPEVGLYTYPDFLIMCGKADVSPFDEETFMNPSVVAEVLSKSTSAFDKGKKFRFYERVPTLKEYMIVDSLSIAAEVWAKNENGLWFLNSRGLRLEEEITLQSINLQLRLSDIYADTRYLVKQ